MAECTSELQQRFRRGMAEIFAALDAEPRQMKVPVELEEDFLLEEVPDFRGRWIAEHPVPLKLSKGRHEFEFLPTTGNRVRVYVRF